MFEQIWQAAAGELSGERAKGYVARIWQHARWNSFDRMQETASEIAGIMGEIGLSGVDMLRFPADGTTSYGGWMMPEAWDVQEAVLEIVEPAVADPVLARYTDCPQSLMMYSAPTPGEGIVAELIVVDGASQASSYDGKALDGKIVLVDDLGLEVGLNCFGLGVAGLVSDCMKTVAAPHAQAGDYLGRAVQWHNYTIPPWRWERKGFGFSVSPADGTRLREFLHGPETVKLRATVKARPYQGTLPLVTGVLPGSTDEEVAITAHLCEPGADDNASGCGLGLEVARTIAELVRTGKLAGMKRGIRLIFSFEVRGYQAYLAGRSSPKGLVAGIDLDMVGNEQSEARSVCNLIQNFACSPAYTDVFAEALLRRLKKDDPLFRYRVRNGGIVDNLFGEPSIGAPMCVVGCWPDAYYHTSLDSLEVVSPAALSGIGRMAATYCAFLTGAGVREALWLAQQTYVAAEEELLQASPEAKGGPVDDLLLYVAEKNAKRLESVKRLVGSRSLVPTEQGLRKNADWISPETHLFMDVEFAGHVDRLCRRLRNSAGHRLRCIEEDEALAKRLTTPGRVPASDSPPIAGLAITRPAGADPVGTSPAMAATMAVDGSPDGDPSEASAVPARPAPLPPTEDLQEKAARMAPLRAFVGALSFEYLDEPARTELKAGTGLSVEWAAPYWLQLTAFWANGRRTAWEIYRMLRHEDGSVQLPTFVNAIEFLVEHGLMRLRPVLTKADLVASLGRVGLRRGSTVIVHSSLGRFGYVEGGAKTVIDSLLECLGPEGTLVMPALSFSWIGNPPFDPACSPSRVGAISEAFRRRHGVLRSDHPTHSVAALGPLAESVVCCHTPDRPVFDRTGAFGKLYDLDARVLMLAPLMSNTVMHMAEEWAGIPFPDFACHILEAGVRREVTVVRAPWHANFEEHYRVLFERGLVSVAPLGEESIHLMRVRDAVDVALEDLRNNPLLVTKSGCQCDFCCHVRHEVGGAGV